MNKLGGQTILVPIDLHGIERSNLETLVSIARQLNRGLLGLVLEDIRLQRVAELPFTTEITLIGGTERSLLRDHLSQRSSRVNTDTRRSLTELAERNRVDLSFEDAAGSRWHTALEMDGQLDLFFPARKLWRPIANINVARGSNRQRLGMLLPKREPPTQVLACAAALLRAGLVGDVYVLSDRYLLPEYLQELYRPGHQLRVQSNFNYSTQSVTALIRQSPYDLLLLPRECLEHIDADSLDAALDKSGCQILVVN